jgi:hypothetical protein
MCRRRFLPPHRPHPLGDLHPFAPSGPLEYGQKNSIQFCEKEEEAVCVNVFVFLTPFQFLFIYLFIYF